jgi:hypothetical protein
MQLYRSSLDMDVITQTLLRVKSAARQERGGPYQGMSSLAVQQYAPIGSRREFTPEEEEEIHKGESRWIPRIFQSYGTPASELMSSPARGALLYGLGGAGLGGLLGTALGAGAAGGPLESGLRESSLPYLMGLAGALGGGGIGALGGYFGRSANNEGIKELMRRLPPHSTKRDLLADPAYQQDIERDHQMALLGNRGTSSALALLAALARR